MDKQSNQETEVVSSSQSLVKSPKNSTKTKKIVAIISAAVGVILIITALLLYFLWWQNPNKMVSDAVVDLLSSDKVEAKSKYLLKSDDAKVEITLNTNMNDKQGSGDAVALISWDSVKDAKVNINGVIDKDGALYVKADNLRDAADVVITAAVDDLAKQYQEESLSQGANLSESELADLKASTRAQYEQMVEPIIEKVNEQWIKFKADDSERNDKTKCYLDVFNEAQKDKKLSREIASAYNKNQFMIIKEEVESKNGSRGFKIDISSQESVDKMKAFVSELKTTDFAKKLEGCDPNALSSIDRSMDNYGKSAKGEVTVWVNSLHQLTSFKFYEKDGGGTEYTFEGDVEVGKAKDVTVPTGARDFKDVYKEIQESYYTQTIEA